MKNHLTSLTSWMAVVLLFFFESAGWAYRPFISTDATVADAKEMEIELGYLDWEREKGNTTFFSPKVVLNYGFITILRSLANSPSKNRATVRQRSSMHGCR